MRSITPLATVGLLVLLGACGNIDSGPYASPDEVARAAYRSGGPPEITLYTMISNRSGAGAHSSILINASQQVIFDPSGSVDFQDAPELDDVIYGVTPRIREIYESAHARETYHVRIQRLRVAPEVAERALRLAQSSGPVGASMCASATSSLISNLPGFEGIGTTMFPNTLADRFARIPGVDDRKMYESDSDDKAQAIALLESDQASQ
jgi:hypothetical protein